jgi:uncharacterized membrane protein YbaN (DUF454 family)
MDIKNKTKSDLKISGNSAIRQIWFICGLICTGLGILGYMLPVMPGTTFIIIALYCFARSNEKWYNKLLNNKYFGETLRDFKAGKGMSMKAKITAIATVIFSISISLYFASNIFVKLFLMVCFIVAISVIVLQKTKVEKRLDS